jgi:cyclopropane fatty-acyl-phospholipid synthase-like methyltransferase
VLPEVRRGGAEMLAPYGRIASAWAQARRLLPREKLYLERFVAMAAARAHVLDLGCGAGTIARYLIDRGCRVTAVDAAPEMLAIARAACPEATFIEADMLDLKLARTFDGIVAWDSVFHVPREAHERLFRAMHSWLRPGAPMVLSVGGSADEFVSPRFGVDFFYSGHAPAATVASLQRAGFEAIEWEVDDPSSRGHIAVTCRRRARVRHEPVPQHREDSR